MSSPYFQRPDTLPPTRIIYLLTFQSFGVKLRISHPVLMLRIFTPIFDANKKGEDLEPKFQVLPFCFPSGFPVRTPQA